MIDITALRAMAAAGATVDVILAAIEADQKSQIEKLTERRAKDAERQRRKRSVHNGHAESRGPSDAVCDPPQHILTPPREKPKKVSLAIEAASVPDQPTADARSFAQSKAWDDARTDREWQRFRDHGIAKGRKHKGEIGLAAAWRSWVTSPYQTSNGAPNAKPGTGGNIVDASRRLEQRIRQFNEPPPGGDLCDRASNPDVRLLSKG
jgi:hypothetical protein